MPSKYGIVVWVEDFFAKFYEGGNIQLSHCLTLTFFLMLSLSIAPLNLKWALLAAMLSKAYSV